MTETERIAFLEGELREANRCNLRLVHRFISRVQVLQDALQIDGRLASALEAWAMTWDVDPDEWRGFLAANPLSVKENRPAEILDLLEQLGALAKLAQEDVLEEVVALLRTIWLLDPSRLASLLAPSVEVVDEIRAKFSVASDLSPEELLDDEAPGTPEQRNER